MSSIAVHPGSFDPITNGHIDLLERSLTIFDNVIIAIAANPGKQPLFSTEERLQMIKDSLAHHPLKDRVKVDLFQGLLVDYVHSVPTRAIVRGLRAISDFEYEFQMVGMNQRLNPEIETVFLMADPRHQAIASRLVKEIAMLGGDVSSFTSPHVAELLMKRCRELGKKK